MTGPFNFNPEAVSATFEALPADEYELIVGEPKAFKRNKSDGEGESIGIRFPLTVAEGTHKGKKTIYNFYMTSEGAQSIGKQFLIAAYGMKRDKAGEEEFNTAFRGADLSYDTATGSCGDAWNTFKGMRLRAALTVRDYNGQTQQEFKPGCFMPLND